MRNYSPRKKKNNNQLTIIDKGLNINTDTFTIEHHELTHNLNNISEQNKLSSIKIDIPIIIVPDKDEPNILFPVKQAVNIPEKFYMQYPITELLFKNKNNFTIADLFTFSFLCDNYSDYAEFSINSSFWDTINLVMKRCNISYTNNSIQRSINKLVKASIVIRIAKACYAINKILVYSGNLQERHSAITNQFLKKAIKDNQTKK